MPLFLKILKKNWLKYYILAILLTCISYLYQRYGWAYAKCSSDCTYEWSFFSDKIQYPIQVAGLPVLDRLAFRVGEALQQVWTEGRAGQGYCSQPPLPHGRTCVPPLPPAQM